MNFNEKVYGVCRRIPKGRISTYKVIAEVLGSKAYRAVGSALRKNPYWPVVPCHRVVSNDGGIGGFGGEVKGKKIQEKIKLLKKEGILVKNGKIVDFEKLLFRF